MSQVRRFQSISLKRYCHLIVQFRNAEIIETHLNVRTL